jgi:F0F1-type ATP synthase assembly protein I
MRQDREDMSESARGLGLFYVIVGVFAGYTIGGAALGYLATKYLGFPDWVMIVTSFLGLYLAIYRILQISKQEERRRNDLGK